MLLQWAYKIISIDYKNKEYKKIIIRILIIEDY